MRLFWRWVWVQYGEEGWKWAVQYYHTALLNLALLNPALGGWASQHTTVLGVVAASVVGILFILAMPHIRAIFYAVVKGLVIMTVAFFVVSFFAGPILAFIDTGEQLASTATTSSLGTPRVLASVRNSGGDPMRVWIQWDKEPLHSHSTFPVLTMAMCSMSTPLRGGWPSIYIGRDDRWVHAVFDHPADPWVWSLRFEVDHPKPSTTGFVALRVATWVFRGKEPAITTTTNTTTMTSSAAEAWAHALIATISAQDTLWTQAQAQTQTQTHTQTQAAAVSMFQIVLTHGQHPHTWVGVFRDALQTAMQVATPPGLVMCEEVPATTPGMFNLVCTGPIHHKTPIHPCVRTQWTHGAMLRPWPTTGSIPNVEPNAEPNAEMRVRSNGDITQ